MGLKFSRENTFDLTRLHLSEHSPLPTLRNDCFHKWDFGPELCEACPSILVWWVHRPPSLAQNSTPGTAEKNKAPLGLGQGESQSPGEPTDMEMGSPNTGGIVCAGPEGDKGHDLQRGTMQRPRPHAAAKSPPKWTPCPGQCPCLLGHGWTGWTLPP